MELKQKKLFTKSLVYFECSAALLCFDGKKQIVVFADMALCYAEKGDDNKAMERLQTAVKIFRGTNEVKIYF